MALMPGGSAQLSKLSQWMRALRFGVAPNTQLQNMPVLLFSPADRAASQMPAEFFPRRYSDPKTISTGQGPLPLAFTHSFVQDAQRRAAKMQIGCDSDMGGKSFAVAEKRVDDGDNGQHAYVRLSGTIDTTPVRGYDRSGYAAMVWNEQLALLDFEGFELGVRSHIARRYTLSVTVSSFGMGTAKFQANFASPESGRWEKVHIPFTQFIKTFQGNVLRRQTPLQEDQILSLSILLSDSVKGPFEIDLRNVHAWADHDLRRANNMAIDDRMYDEE
ncbi:hypothetical protein FVE85_2098 [Porphyridium purpureum]|uniref:NADH:ubiquinone oxidoreductase intermediate-associated protein 30 domain-containing protein n=1 Tax=Porphyridium purpureum TaxID=35688 RepID=A0A5J4YZ85_PORPP|nr:hypothetical protein FVE85_2098 [Porphyridium purpureum]|eukprot:POR2105..scf209_3